MGNQLKNNNTLTTNNKMFKTLPPQLPCSPLAPMPAAMRSQPQPENYTQRSPTSLVNSLQALRAQVPWVQVLPSTFMTSIASQIVKMSLKIGTLLLLFLQWL